MPNVKAESSASFRIISKDLSPSDISSQLRLEPTATHHVGEVTAAGDTLPHSVWCLESPLGKEHGIDEHLIWLARELRQRLPELRSLLATEDVSFFCTYHLLDSDYGGFTLSPGALAIALDLGARIECHVMCLAEGIT